MHKMRARDVMSTPVHTLELDEPVKAAAELFVDRGIGGAPVVDRNGLVVGILTESDLLQKEIGAPRHAAVVLLPWRSRDIAEQERRFEARRVVDAMTSEPCTVTEDTTLREVAATMAKRNIHRMPVVRDRRPVGMITRHDVMRSFAREDDELASDVTDALLRDLLIDPDLLSITVRDGAVTIAGEVERRSEIRLVEKFAHAIDGVVGTDVSGMSYRYDDV